MKLHRCSTATPNCDSQFECKKHADKQTTVKFSNSTFNNFFISPLRYISFCFIETTTEKKLGQKNGFLREVTEGDEIVLYVRK